MHPRVYDSQLILQPPNAKMEVYLRRPKIVLIIAPTTEDEIQNGTITIDAINRP